jgi:hypothetical protein
LDDIIIITLIVLRIRILWLIVRCLLLTISLSAIGIRITLILGIGWLLATFVVSYWFIASVLDFHFFHFGAIFLDVQLILNLPFQSVANPLIFLKIRKHLVVVIVPFQLAVRVFIYPGIERIMTWFLLVRSFPVPRLRDRSFKYLYYVSFIVCDILVPSILLKFGVCGAVGEWLALNT